MARLGDDRRTARLEDLFADRHAQEIQEPANFVGRLGKVAFVMGEQTLLRRNELKEPLVVNLPQKQAVSEREEITLPQGQRDLEGVTYAVDHFDVRESPDPEMRGKTIARVFPPPGFTAKEVLEKHLRLALQPQEPIFGGPGGGRCIVPSLAKLLEEFIVDPGEFRVLPMAVRVVRLGGQQVAVGPKIEPSLAQHIGYHGSARAVHSRDTNGHRRPLAFVRSDGPAWLDPPLGLLVSGGGVRSPEAHTRAGGGEIPDAVLANVDLENGAAILRYESAGDEKNSNSSVLPVND